ncbi:hypothetical protein MAC_03107 [Metarhizium acridum CQMa 102]|uniref:Uncharacterized protein n=1 Tax=Metarhizium acridum (strain CQMa 102) TaxID=655827 RepID=E9DZQ9_METAQ|nr:uncharacterized protein MAC_03107 [Metarhizium acridum CQMa 102]EFY90744.1 hypothetical protein MAC_03107 [Metarhizium acridum CQMa 102]
MGGTSTNTTAGLGAIHDLPVQPEPDLSVSTGLEFSAGSADGAESSISSEKGDSKPPRSAMRRSSSIPKLPQSPRRVRFDFMGEEVLPTTSPQPSAFISARISSPDPIGDGENCASHLATEPGEEDEEEEGEERAPPRKVSSSDALRFLSRAPLEEDGTIWTVINSDPDPDEAVPDQPHFLQESQAVDTAPSVPTTMMATSGANALGPTCAATTPEPSHKHTIVGDTKGASSNSEEDSSDDDFLAVAKLKRPVSSVSRAQALLSPTKSSQRATSVQLGDQSRESPKAKTLAASNASGEATHRVSATIEDDNELFHFEEEGLQLPERPRQTRNLAAQIDPDDGQSDHDEESSGTPTPQPLSLYATSPAVPITRPANRDREPDPTTPSRAKFEPNTVGSYKGRPLTIPILRNPEILSQLEFAQPVNEVVGSVHHRGPTDAFNPASLQESAEQAMVFSAPRSFSERLMIEDMMEAAKARSPVSGAGRTEHGQ